MRYSIAALCLAILAPLVVAVPTPTEDIVPRAEIVKRATITDVADTGYATQNGGYVLLSMFLLSPTISNC